VQICVAYHRRFSVTYLVQSRQEQLSALDQTNCQHQTEVLQISPRKPSWWFSLPSGPCKVTALPGIWALMESNWSRVLWFRFTLNIRRGLP